MKDVVLSHSESVRAQLFGAITCAPLVNPCREYGCFFPSSSIADARWRPLCNIWGTKVEPP